MNRQSMMTKRIPVKHGYSWMISTVLCVSISVAAFSAHADQCDATYGDLPFAYAYTQQLWNDVECNYMIKGSTEKKTNHKSKNGMKTINFYNNDNWVECGGLPDVAPSGKCCIDKTPLQCGWDMIR